MKRIQDEIFILLPDTVYLKRAVRKGLPEEYNIYFKNIVFLYKEEWDIVIHCKYGENLGHCWRLTDFSMEEDAFDFEMVIYNEFGERLAAKKTRFVVTERKLRAPVSKVMFFGDSMTYWQVYLEYITNKLYNIKTMGTRSCNHRIFHEGRGGWSYRKYYNTWENKDGVSPFLFPKDMEPLKYYGNLIRNQSKLV